MPLVQQLTDRSPLRREQFLASESQTWSLTVTDTGVVKHDRDTGQTFYVLRLKGTAELRIRGRELQAISDGQVAWHALLPAYLTMVKLGDDGELYATDPTSPVQRRVPINLPLGPVLAPLPGSGRGNRFRTRVRMGWKGRLPNVLASVGGVAALISLVLALRPRTPAGYAPIWPIWSEDQSNKPIIAAIVFGIVALVLLGLVAYAARPEDEEAIPNLVRATLSVVVPIVVYAIAAALILFSADDDSLGHKQYEERAQLFAVVSVIFAVIVTGLLFRQRSRQSTADVSLAQVMSTKTSAASTVLLLWTFVVVYGIALISGWQLVAGAPGFVCQPEAPGGVKAIASYCVQGDSWYQYLLLLGVPGAAAALSKQKQADGAPLDTSTQNTNAVAEVQYFIFNAIAMVFVLASLLTGAGKLPEIPSVVLALTGASALVYTVEKRVPAK